MSDLTSISKVVSVAPDLIEIEVFETDKYRQMDPLRIGNYIEISDSNGGNNCLIAVIKGFRVKDSINRDFSADRAKNDIGVEQSDPKFIITMQPVGRLLDGAFIRGANEISIPPKYIKVASDSILSSIYGANNVTAPLSFGSLVQDPEIAVNLYGDRFFSKHIGVVGSTGSGKSSTVAAILQQGIERSKEQADAGLKNNSHIIIFDLHGEYSSAFPEANVLSADNIVLPYWLMNSEELEEMFIESSEHNSYNQLSQFRAAVNANKHIHNPKLSKISYDDPVYFSLVEVINYLDNLNREVIGKTEEFDGKPKLENGEVVEDRFKEYFEHRCKFAAPSQKSADKSAKGPFNGEFDRFLMRLRAKVSDSRLSFLLQPRLEKNIEPKTDQLEQILQQVLGYERDGVNVTIFDLSGVPFEVLNNVVSLVSRLCFTFCVNFKKVHTELGDCKDLPFLLVLEEAHNYISRSEGAKYRPVRKSIERIAKEGRKYGLSLMIVSQRPGEISETIFSQCSNFVAMRLTNSVDQNYVRRLLPDDVSAITDSIASLGQREALIIGDSVSLPTLIKVNSLRSLPSSSDVKFLQEWRKDWDAQGLDGVIATMIGR